MSSTNSPIPAVIPVMDLMIGQVVLAQGGNREQYLPVQSRLVLESDPLAVAHAMFQQTGCDWMYLADIDSFSGANPSWHVYNRLLDQGFGLWVDADWIRQDRYLEIAQRVANTRRLRIIVSSETLHQRQDFEVFDALLQSSLTPIFSLDKKGQQLITRSDELGNCSQWELIQLAQERGVEELILLDLQEVGTANGYPAENEFSSLIEEIRSEFPGTRMTTGGGVRHAEDVRAWLDSGCHHVLVASAIHNCEITPDDVSELTCGARWCVDGLDS